MEETSKDVEKSKIMVLRATIGPFVSGEPNPSLVFHSMYSILDFLLSTQFERKLLNYCGGFVFRSSILSHVTTDEKANFAGPFLSLKRKRAVVMAQGQVKKAASQLVKGNKKPQNNKLGKGGMSEMRTTCAAVF